MEIEFNNFHGYTVWRDSTVIGKTGKKLKFQLRERNGGKLDKTITLYYGGKKRKWTLSRLVVACFQGPIDGYQINHKDRDTMNCHNDNLERSTPSENQLHWRMIERKE